MNRRVTLLLTIILGLTCLNLAAKEKIANDKTTPSIAGRGEKIPPHKINWKKKATSGSSSVTYYLDKDGVPTEVYVIGMANLPTTMRSVDAVDFASKRAELQAKTRFALWLQESISIAVQEERKMLVVFGGGKENSETTDLQKSKITQAANNFWRGMSPYWYSKDPKNGRYISVWRWSVKESEIARLVEILAHDGEITKKDNEPNVKPNFHVEASEGFL